MIEGSGELITKQDEEGYNIPFLSTEQILQQLEKFGFIIDYNVRSNLPDKTIDFLATIDNLGYDRITRILLQQNDKYGNLMWKPAIVVYKSMIGNEDLISYDAKITQAEFLRKIDVNSILNVTYEQNINWDWVTSMFIISDVLNENIDDRDPFETETDVQTNVDQQLTEYTDPSGYTVYQGEDNDTE